jgi:hypothetical protein
MRTHHPPKLAQLGLRIPAADVETYLANGWRLLDEPLCGAVRMLPPKGGISRETFSQEIDR